MIAFLISPEAESENDIDMAVLNVSSFPEANERLPLSQNCQAQGGGSPPLSQDTPENRQVANNKVNCQIDIHHINSSCFKIVIKPIFHTQSFLLRKMLSKMDPSQMSQQDTKHWNEIQSNNELLLNLQPNNTNNLIIDLEIANPSLWFEKANYSKFLNKKDPSEKQLDSYKVIDDTQSFFEKRLKKFVTALEELLLKEFKDFFESQSPNELLNQYLLSLIIDAKVVYAHLGIREKGTTGAGGKAEANRDQMFVVLRGCNGGTNDDLKVVCLFAESGTDDPVQVSIQNHGTKVSTLNDMFGQKLDLSFTLQDHYILANLCKVYLKSLSLAFAPPESDSESSASFGGDNSNSISESESGSNSSTSKADASRRVPSIASKEIIHMCSQRRITTADQQPVAVTFTLLAVQEGKKMLGVRAVAHNPAICHESGVFFLID
jgi:hypothetical protein